MSTTEARQGFRVDGTASFEVNGLEILVEIRDHLAAIRAAVESGPPAPSTGDLLTVREVSEMLRVSDRAVRRWIDEGDLPISRVGRLIRIKRSDVEVLSGGR